MGNTNNKSKFITKLFLYYKNALTKEKQIQLLLNWTDSCLEKEEYEMASTLKTLLYEVENDINTDKSGDLGVIKIPDNLELVYNDKFINGKLPEIVTKSDEKPVIIPKKWWKWVNLWEEPSDFTIIKCSFSRKSKEFTLITLNYGITFIFDTSKLI